MDCDTKNTGHKDAATFCENMEGSETYCCTIAEWRGGMEIWKREKPGLIQIPFKYKNHSMDNIQTSKIPPSTTTIIDKGDNAASKNYLPLRYIAKLQDVVSDKFSPTVVLPDTYTLTENTTRQLPLSSSLSYS